jgi:Ni2+-binding GTPase involved in maturation of urease and hydrogenase
MKSDADKARGGRQVIFTDLKAKTGTLDILEVVKRLGGLRHG